MLFSIDRSLFDLFPHTRVARVIARGITQKNGADHARDQLAAVQNNAAQACTTQDISRNPAIETWKKAYEQFGLDPKIYKSSVEALALRAVKKKVRSIAPLVDCYNSASIEYLMPMGGWDLTSLRGDILLTRATGGESVVTLDGETSQAVAGEVIYRDAEGIVCRGWNWREAHRVLLKPDTTEALFLVEAIAQNDGAALTAAAHTLALRLRDWFGADATIVYSDASQPSITLRRDGGLILYEQPSDAGSHATNFSERWSLCDTTARERSSEYLVRSEKVAALTAAGIAVWADAPIITATTAEAIAQFSEQSTQEFSLAGRLMSRREHGKTAFAHIQDRAGRIQVYIKEEHVGADTFALFSHKLDIGDIVWLSGTLFRTKTGEITVMVSALSLLSKSLHPLPEKFHGLTDVEVQYRQRYLDLIMNAAARERFIRRSMVISRLRHELESEGFMEVETPMLHPIPGGAAARPFVTHHNALDQELYLRIAPELYLKRLVVGGFDRVFEINRNFRNEGISTRHNPEFTMVELYCAYKEYVWMMDFLEGMIRRIIKQVCGTLIVERGDKTINFEKPFARITAREALLNYAGMAEADLAESAIDATLKKHGVAVTSTASHMAKIFALFEECAEKSLVDPTYIIDFPIEISPLARRDGKRPDIAARFELYIAGMELANGFNELNDPFDQAERFKEHARAHASGDAEAMRYDADYVVALEHALPPTAGAGIGVDRLVMLATSAPSIKDVILFPTLKRKD